MEATPLPPDENERQRNLWYYRILDTAPEEAFDEITAYAAERFEVPISLVSLVDANRQWFKSCIGLQVNETGRHESFCSHAILSNEPFIIPDTLADNRFADNPLVSGEPYIRFYAGAPLVSPENYRLGTLCLIDVKPRQLSQQDRDNLIRLSKLVIARLTLRLADMVLEHSARTY